MAGMMGKIGRTINNYMSSPTSTMRSSARAAGMFSGPNSMKRQYNRQARRAVGNIDAGIRKGAMMRRGPASNTMFDLSTGPSRMSGAATSGVGKYERRALRMSKMRRMGRNIVATDQEIMRGRLNSRPTLPSLDEYLNG